MTKLWMQFTGMVCLTALAMFLLVLMGYLFGDAIDHMSPDGKIPMFDASMFSTCLVTFQTVVGAIRSIWESQERTALAEGLSNSTPTSKPNPPADDLDPVSS